MNPNLTPDQRPTTRRDFLKTSAAFASTVALTPLAIERSAHAAGSDIIRIGLIGCGGRGTDAAVNAMKAGNDVRLVALADIFRERLENSRKQLKTAKPDAVEFVQREIPDAYFPPGYRPDDPWGTAFFGNLVHNFCQEIVDGGPTNQGDFAQSARVQEVINAVALSHREHRWVSLPLADQVEIRTSPF